MRDGQEQGPRDDLGDAVALVRRRGVGPARAGVVLGTGLGGLVDELRVAAAIPYEEIPGWDRTTAAGHRGRLLFGTLDGVPVLALDGRRHGYEGCDAATLARPIRLLAALGVETLVLTNASGGLDPHLEAGDVVGLADHLDLTFRRGPASCGAAGGRGLRLGPSPYDATLLSAAIAAARRAGFAVRRAVYAAVTGPNYETRAEYRFLRRIGADVVGMSTAWEAITARACGLRVLALSTVTNVARPDAPPHVTRHEEVLAAGAGSAARVALLVRDAVRSCG